MECKKAGPEPAAARDRLSDEEIIEKALAIIAEKISGKGPLLTSSEKAKDYLAVKMSGYDREVMAVLFLDASHRVIALEELFWGTLSRNTIYLREIAKRAFHHNAAAVILAHNHPSGNPSPSQDDIDLTRKAKEALALIDIRLLDHLIAAGPACLSMADQGFL